MAITVQPSRQRSHRLLRMSLLANAIFSGLSGFSFLAIRQLVALPGWSHVALLTLGVGLIGFALLVTYTTRTLHRDSVYWIILLDSLWVLASSILLLTPWPTAAMRWTMAILAVIIAGLAALQYLGLRKADHKSSFRVAIEIKAPIRDVWNVLADIGIIAQWHPGVIASKLTSKTIGVGSSRHCDLKGDNFLDEQVIVWQPEKHLGFRIYKSNLPMRADIHFHLRAVTGHTVVTVRPEYNLHYGLLGLLLDVLYFRQRYKAGMRALLTGLKRHLEAP